MQTHLSNISLITQQFEEARDMLNTFLADGKQVKQIEKAGQIMVDAIKTNHKIISCGNGGSMCDAMHFAEELSGLFRAERQALPAIAISDPSHITCAANDYGFDAIFSRYIEAIGQPGDVLLAISTSGNSENIIRASIAAKEKNMKVIGLTGKNGGKLGSLCDVEIRSPYSVFSDRTQEIHIKIIHALILFIEKNIFS
jgi:D-sedoheptulose 7-phosphate isomerase